MFGEFNNAMKAVFILLMSGAFLFLCISCAVLRPADVISIEKGYSHYLPQELMEPVAVLYQSYADGLDPGLSYGDRQHKLRVYWAELMRDFALRVPGIIIRRDDETAVFIPDCDCTRQLYESLKYRVAKKPEVE